MEYPADLLVPVNSANSAAALPGRRLHYRQRLSTLAYINLDQNNGGIVRDISEAGIAIQTVAPLRLNQQIDLRFDLLKPRLHVEALGRVAWADPRGQAGVQFLDLNDRARRPLKQWIFTQLLARAEHAVDAGFVFSPRPVGEEVDQLLFSAPPRPAIRLETETAHQPIQMRHRNISVVDPREASATRSSVPSFDTAETEASAATVRLPWLPISIPGAALANSVDGLIIIAAVVLFFALATAVTQTFPSSLVAAALALIVMLVFAALYRFLFRSWMDATPGMRLAQLASNESAGGDSEEDRPRFR